MSRSRDLANLANNSSGLETLTVSDITDLTASATELNYVDGVGSALQTQINAKAPLASPAFTGTPTGITGNHITTGTLGNAVQDNITRLGAVTTGTIGGGVAMASSGLTVRNIAQVALASDGILENTNTLTAIFTPTYTPKFANSKIQFILTYAISARRATDPDGRKRFVISLSGSGITDFDWGYDDIIVGGYDFGASGIVVAYHTSVMGPLIDTSTTDTITAQVKFKNDASSANSTLHLFGNGTTNESYMTWIEYK